MKDFIKITEYIELYELCKKELKALDSKITELLHKPDRDPKSMYAEFLQLSKPGDLQELALCLYRLKETLSQETENKDSILKALAKQVKDWIDVAEKVQYDKNELDEIRELIKDELDSKALDRFLRLSRLDNPTELLWHLKGYKATGKTDLPDKAKVQEKYKAQIESWFKRAEENEHKGNLAILKDKERDSLRKAVDKSSSSNKTFFVSYLSVLLYLIITVSNVTDEQFLLNKPVNLPWLNISIPLFGFFIFAPLIFLATHFNVIYNLIKHIELIHKFASFAGRRDMEVLERYQLSPFLFNYLVLHEFESEELSWKTRIPALLLSGVAYLILAFAPIGLLSFVQVRFSSYQDMGITSWHLVVLILDLVLVSYLFIKIFITSWEGLASKLSLGFHGLAILFVLIVSILNYYYLIEVLGLRNAPSIETLKSEFKESLRFKLFPRLSIRGKNLVEALPSDMVLMGAYISGEKNMDEVTLRHTKGIDVSGRNLVYLVLIECNITNANFKKAFLNGAVFFNTNIDKANFFNAEITGAQPEDELRTLKGINKFMDK